MDFPLPWLLRACPANRACGTDEGLVQHQAQEVSVVVPLPHWCGHGSVVQEVGIDQLGDECGQGEITGKAVIPDPRPLQSVLGLPPGQSSSVVLVGRVGFEPTTK